MIKKLIVNFIFIINKKISKLKKIFEYYLLKEDSEITF